MNTKQIGHIAEIAFLLECANRKITVSIPYGDNARYDFIVDINNKLLKVQVKHMKDKGKYYSFATRSTDWNSKIFKNYKDDVDYIFAYCKDDKNYVLVPVSKITQSSMTIRKHNAISTQIKKMNIIEDYQKWFDEYDA